MKYTEATLFSVIKGYPHMGTTKDWDITVNKGQYKQLKKEKALKQFRSVKVKPYQRHIQVADALVRYYVKVMVANALSPLPVFPSP